MPRLNAFTNRILVGKGLRRRVSVIVTLASNTTNYTLGTAQIPGYIAGATDVTLVVNSGVYVYSTNTANAGLTVAALAAGDTVSIVNNGYIIGKGGNGVLRASGTAGGPALTINRSVSITNNSYIAGGGGGGGGSFGNSTGEYGWCSGGGGAGGGDAIGGYGGTGGAPGQTGTNGIHVYSGGSTGTGYGGGGGGGRILPGVGGARVQLTLSFGSGQTSSGNGGGAGGGGGAVPYFQSFGVGEAGGSNNDPGVSGTTSNTNGGGGGGGWGASGGNGTNWNNVLYTGAAGGKAVNLNGNTVTWLANGTRWGAIS
jgi:hypothetical protein